MAKWKSKRAEGKEYHRCPRENEERQTGEERRASMVHVPSTHDRRMQKAEKGMGGPGQGSQANTRALSSRNTRRRANSQRLGCVCCIIVAEDEEEEEEDDNDENEQGSRSCARAAGNASGSSNKALEMTQSSSSRTHYDNCSEISRNLKAAFPTF